MQYLSPIVDPLILHPQLGMSIPALLTIAATLSNLFVMIFVLRKNPSGILNRLWSIAIFCLVVWGSGELIMRTTSNATIAEIANRISGVGFCFIPSVFLHFALVFSEQRRLLGRWWMHVIVYAPGVAFSMLQTMGYVTSVIPVWWGFTANPSDVFLPYLLWLQVYFWWGLFLCYRKLRLAKSRRERSRTLFVILGVIVPLIPASVTDGLLPLLGKEPLRIAVVATTTTAVFITYAIVKFQLMSLTPQTTASLILNTLSDFLSVVDTDGYVVFANESFRKIILGGAEKVEGCHASEFIVEHREVLEALPHISDPTTEQLSREAQYATRRGAVIPVALSISRIYDRDECVGFVFLAHDITQRKSVERALRESEIRFRTVWEHSSDAMRLTDCEGMIIAANQAFCQLVEMTSDQLVGQRLTVTYVGGKNADDMLRNYQTRFAQRAIPSQLEQKLTLRSGKTVYIEGRNSFIDFGIGEALLLGVFRDVTERRQAEEALKKLSSAVEQTADTVVITDRDGAIEYVNPAFSELTGYTREEAIGKTPRILKSGKQSEQFYKNLWATILAGQVFRSEFANRKKDGQLHYEEKTITPVRDTSGTITHFVATGKDISERKAKERQVQMLAQTITSLNECVSITDMEDNIITVNPAFLRTYGYEAHEVIGKNIRFVRSVRNPSGATEQILSETLKHGWHGELMNMRKNGEEFPIDLRTSIVYDVEGTPIALVGIARDITEEKRMQQQLEEAMRQRSEDLRQFALSLQQTQEAERRRIARELHDDLGQRLVGAKLQLMLLEDEIPKSSGGILEKLHGIERHIDTITTDVRTLCSNLRPVALDDFGLMMALRMLAADFEKVLGIKMIFETNISPHARYNPDAEIALYRITQEALTNIAKHARATEVSINQCVTANALSLSVRDNGRGFDPNRTRLQRGTARGLGLIGMKERAEFLGGVCKVESVPEQGTRVRVEIPLQSDEYYEKDPPSDR